MSMEEQILSELAEIERSEDVRILLAVESGSRAWGFESRDSDYDVRFVYARRPEWYLQLEKTRDVIEWKLDDVLDINGWDLQKALRLMRDSNPSLFEWLSSPVVYRPLEDKRLAELAARSFSPYKALQHYLSMARRTRLEHLYGEQVKLKKYFYVLRPLLAAEHVAKRREQPPMLFDDLVREHLDAELVPVVNELLDLKRLSDETLYVPANYEINAWIGEKLGELEARVEELPRGEKLPWSEYDELFLEVLGM